MTSEYDLETKRVMWTNEKGSPSNIPALDARWCEEKEFPLYYALKSMENVIVDPWCTNMSVLIRRCKWILKLKFHKFWSYVVYGDKSFHEMLDSYLLNCPRYSEPFLMNLTFFSPKQKVADLQNALHRLIFLIFVRMAARKAGEDFLSNNFHSKLIYENYLFDVPRLMDLCALYGQDNERMTQKIVEQIFKSQPKYYDDLKECTAALISLFQKCEKSIDTRVGEKVQLLNTRSSRYDDRVKFDAIYYLVDVVYSLSSFIKFCPKSAEIFHENGLSHRLPLFFENTYPILYEVVLPIEGAKFNQHKNMLGRLAYFEKVVVDVFRELICINSFAYLIGKTPIKNKTNDECLDDFLQSISFAVQEKHFAAAYNEKYPFVEDLKLLREKNVDVDNERSEYFKTAFASMLRLDTKENDVVKLPTEVIKGVKESDNNKPSASDDTSKHIRDIFPHLSQNMIEKVLSYYDGNVENTVIALANNDYPQELNDEFLQSSSAGAAASMQNYGRIVDEESISDISKQTDEDEEYLVPLVSSKKRGLQASLEDKSTLKDLRSVYERYQFETPDDDEENVETGEGGLTGDVGDELKRVNIYDDEYDDTYDEHNVNVEGDTLPEEMIEMYYRRSKSNMGTGESEEASASLDSSKATGEGEPTGRNWQGNYTGGRDRQNKERHKGHYAHHNRKDRALHKHSRGFGFY